MPSRPGLFHLFLKDTGYPILDLLSFVVLVGLWCISSAVLHAKSVCEDEHGRDSCVYCPGYVFVCYTLEVALLAG